MLCCRWGCDNISGLILYEIKKCIEKVFWIINEFKCKIEDFIEKNQRFIKFWAKKKLVPKYSLNLIFENEKYSLYFSCN